MPKITIQGQWLESFGFSIGDKLVVTCEQGRFIIEKLEDRYESERIKMVVEPAVEHKGRRATSHERHKPDTC